MNHDFKVHLTLLSQRSQDDFEQELRARVPRYPARPLARRLKNFVMVMPDMIRQIRAWINDPASPPALKSLHGFMLTYLYHPLDFVPESNRGLFGYVDDAYLIGQLYLEAATRLDRLNYLPNTESLSRQIPFWLRWTRLAIPKESAQVDALLSELRRQKADSFYRMMGHAPENSGATRKEVSRRSGRRSPKAV